MQASGLWEALRETNGSDAAQRERTSGGVYLSHAETMLTMEDRFMSNRGRLRVVDAATRSLAKTLYRGMFALFLP